MKLALKDGDQKKKKDHMVMITAAASDKKSASTERRNTFMTIFGSFQVFPEIHLSASWLNHTFAFSLP